MKMTRKTFEQISCAVAFCITAAVGAVIVDSAVKDYRADQAVKATATIADQNDITLEKIVSSKKNDTSTEACISGHNKNNPAQKVEACFVYSNNSTTLKSLTRT